MPEVLTEFEDEYGNSFVVLSEDDDGEDMRNARRVPPPRIPGGGSGARVIPARRRPRTHRTPRVHRATPVQVVGAPDAVTFKLSKVGGFLELLGEGVAELIPLPDKPPEATGQDEIDLQNQNEHRHALHAHRVLTSRIRTAGRLGSKLLKMLIDED